MKIRKLVISSILSVAFLGATAEGIDYTTGVFVVNEDWFGHQNSTLNYLLPDDADGNYWNYRVVQTENPGLEIGCTAEYGTVYNGRIYIVSKQDKDNGASVTGGRLTIIDAVSMKVLKQLRFIAPEGTQCDGRAFIGVDKSKGYLSTSNGVWTLDLDAMEVTGMIEGTGNVSDNLYRGQCGTMVMASGKVFVAHQNDGLIVIDTADDTVEKVISIPEITGDEKAGIGSVVIAKDGSLWISIAKSTNGNGSTLPMIVRLDPVTFESEVVDIPTGMYPPANSWYAWTPDGFCASATENALYWNGGANTWFSGSRIFKMDVDTREVKLHIDYSSDPDKWQIYGCSMRPDPRNGELYVSLYKQFASKAYTLRRYSPDGTLIKEYPMIENYWFPSLPFFPENGDGASVDVPEISETCVTGDIYSISGVCVARGCTLDSRPELTPGIYIFRSATESRKFIVRQ